MFSGLPERTRLQRLLKTHQDWFDSLLAEPGFFTVIDTYPIELIFPIREGRRRQQVGKKSKDMGPWSIGVKLCWLLNDTCRVVAMDWDTMNGHDKQFHPGVDIFVDETILLADFGFRSADGHPQNMKLCKKVVSLLSVEGKWSKKGTSILKRGNHGCICTSR